MRIYGIDGLGQNEPGDGVIVPNPTKGVLRIVDRLTQKPVAKLDITMHKGTVDSYDRLIAWSGVTDNNGRVSYNSEYVAEGTPAVFKVNLPIDAFTVVPVNKYSDTAPLTVDLPPSETPSSHKGDNYIGIITLGVAAGLIGLVYFMNKK